MVKKGAILIAVFWLAVVVMMPKEALYYRLEQELAKKDINISYEKISEGWFALSLIKPSVYVKGIKVATLEEIEIFTLLFYNRVSLKGVLLERSLERFAPGQIDLSILTHSVFSPFKVVISANGAFGEAEGSVELKAHQLKLKFSDVKHLGLLRSKLKKEEEGWIYEASF